MYEHGMTLSSTYNSWKGMKQRCTNPKDPSFARYGGAGITFDERWRSFGAFLEDMGVRPAGTSLDRIDGSGNYTRENCRWATGDVQCANRKSSIYCGGVLEAAIVMRRAGRSYREIDAHFGAKKGSAWYALAYKRGI